MSFTSTPQPKNGHSGHRATEDARTWVFAPTYMDHAASMSIHPTAVREEGGVRVHVRQTDSRCERTNNAWEERQSPPASAGSEHLIGPRRRCSNNIISTVNYAHTSTPPTNVSAHTHAAGWVVGHTRVVWRQPAAQCTTHVHRASGDSHSSAEWYRACVGRSPMITCLMGHVRAGHARYVQYLRHPPPSPA